MRWIGNVAIVGAGPAGALLATLLAEAGADVVVYERRSDLRKGATGGAADRGRSINLTLAKRGIVALESIGVMDRVSSMAMPLAGRMIHAGGRPRFHRYGRRVDDVIHSVSRNGLNRILLDRAEETGRVRFEFDTRIQSMDPDRGRLTMTGGRTADYDVVFGADGSNSVLRSAMVDSGRTEVEIEPLGHGYKELLIPAGADRLDRLRPDALHIWPRGGFMLMAFANPDTSFTVTLFLPNDGDVDSFAALTGKAGVERFFRRYFPTFVPLVSDLADQFVHNPVGRLRTVRTSGWSVADRACLVGDGAHTIVPFHGQGMNLALESVQVLFECLLHHPDDRAAAFRRYEERQKPNADAIAEMALANYLELRSDVIEPRYLLEREVAFELERRWPQHFATRYDMVTFSTIPFAVARDRWERQSQVLGQLAANATDPADIDYDGAGRLVEALGPLPPSRPAKMDLSHD